MIIRHKNIVILVVIYCLFCGCYSHRWIRESDIEKIPADQKRILLYWKNQKIPQDNVQIIENQITGKIGEFALYNNLTRVHLYSAFPLEDSIATYAQCGTASYFRLISRTQAVALVPTHGEFNC